jgi:hypothetical protein
VFQKSALIDLSTGPRRIRELTVADVWDWHHRPEAGDDPDGFGPFIRLFCFLSRRCAGLSLAGLAQLYPRELNRLWADLKAVNAGFFGPAEAETTESQKAPPREDDDPDRIKKALNKAIVHLIGDGWGAAVHDLGYSFFLRALKLAADREIELLKLETFGVRIAYHGDADTFRRFMDEGKKKPDHAKSGRALAEQVRANKGKGK